MCWWILQITPKNWSVSNPTNNFISSFALILSLFYPVNIYHSNKSLEYSWKHANVLFILVNISALVKILIDQNQKFVIELFNRMQTTTIFKYNLKFSANTLFELTNDLSKYRHVKVIASQNFCEWSAVGFHWICLFVYCLHQWKCARFTFSFLLSTNLSNYTLLSAWVRHIS